MLSALLSTSRIWHRGCTLPKEDQLEIPSEIASSISYCSKTFRLRGNELRSKNEKEHYMFLVVYAICICLATLPVLGQSTTKYQVGTITDVKPHQAAADAGSGVVSYDVSVKVAGTIYLVLYTSPLNMSTVRYATGRDLLVLVGKSTITYNDILGQSMEVPIVSRTPAADAKQSKSRPPDKGQ
jgi:hypothetical protein